jgi:hypothetical protein
MNEHRNHPLSDYVRAGKAAQMLGMTRNRVYEHIRSNSLPAIREGKIYLILIKDIEGFKAKGTGRTHEKPLLWRAYKAGAQVLATEIDVKVRPGKQELLQQRLQAMRVNEEHTFQGTIARFITRGDADFTSVHMTLIWKSTEMPDEETQRANMAAFQEALADVLDWQSARIEMTDVLLHT